VDSGYCQVPLATVESQINSWYAWYGGDGIEGIFVDEAASPYSPLKQSDCLSGTTSAVIYYQTISAYVHAEGVNQTVTLNYGANPVSGWALSSGIAAQNANILVVFEDPYSEYVNYANSGQPWSPSLWESSYSASHFSILIYDATNANLPERSVRRSLSRTSASPTPHPVAGGRRPRRVGISRVNLTAVDTTLKVAHTGDSIVCVLLLRRHHRR